MKHLSTKLLAALLCLCMGLFLLPGAARAVNYLEGDVMNDYNLTDDSEISAGKTFYVSENLFLHDYSLTVRGTLHLGSPTGTIIDSDTLGTIYNYGLILFANLGPSLEYGSVLYNFGLLEFGTSGGSVTTDATSKFYDLSLKSLALSAGTLSPAFEADVYSYTATVPSSTSSLTFRPTLSTGTGVAGMIVDGTAAGSGSPITVNLSYGDNTIPILIIANDTAGTTNTYTLTVTRPHFTFTTQPAAATSQTEGSIAGSLSAAATAAPGFTPAYNWYACNAGGTISGGSLGTGATFAVPTGLTAGTYYYLCQVSAAGATAVNSSVARVTVTAPHSITVTTQPAAASTFPLGGVSGSLSAAATVSNSATPTYNWYACNAGGTISGGSLGTGATFAIPTGLTAGTYYYLCQVSAAGVTAVNSSVARVTVTAPVTYPKTGDDSHTGLWLGLALLSGAGLALLARSRKRHVRSR